MQNTPARGEPDKLSSRSTRAYHFNEIYLPFRPNSSVRHPGA